MVKYCIVVNSGCHYLPRRDIANKISAFIVLNLITIYILIYVQIVLSHATAAAKSLQSCPTLCDPIDGSPSGSTVPGILQARTLEWVAISFSNACKLKVIVMMGTSRLSVVSDPLQLHGLQPTRPLHPRDFPGKSTRVGCQWPFLVLSQRKRKKSFYSLRHFSNTFAIFLFI